MEVNRGRHCDFLSLPSLDVLAWVCIYLNKRVTSAEVTNASMVLRQSILNDK